jgi:hypothetical protein
MVSIGSRWKMISSLGLTQMGGVIEPAVHPGKKKEADVFSGR